MTYPAPVPAAGAAGTPLDADASAAGSGDAEYAAERSRAVLSRLRTGAAVGVPLLVAAWLLGTWVLPGDPARRHEAFVAIAAVVAATLVLARGPRAERHAVALAVGYHVLVAGGLGWLLTAVPAGFPGLVGPVALATAAAALMVPWGVVPQGVVSMAFAGAFLALHPVTALSAATLATGLFTLGMGIGVSLVGAGVIEQQRREAFARRRQLQVEREQARALAEQRRIMADASRLLGGTIAVPELCDRVAEVACWFPDVDGAAVSVPDRSGGTMRIVATCGEPWRSFRDIEYLREGAEPSLDLVRAAGLLELPDLAAGHPVPTWFPVVGVGRALMAPVEHDGALLAVLAVGRRDAAPFSADTRRLVQVLVSQAALALANAHLVENVQRAMAVKAEFVSMMSHEIRTPLNVITGYVEMLQEGAADPATVLQRLAHASRELLELVQATLDVGRLDAGQDGPHPEPVALGRLWDELGADLAQLERQPGVQLVWTPSADGVVVTDPRKLRIVVKNLVGNALKFTARGVVAARCRTGAGRILIEVRDTGCGIPAAELPHVFEMFRQVQGREQSRGGVGLGLYIVRTLVEQLGGEVRVESVERLGTTFWVDIPDRR